MAIATTTQPVGAGVATVNNGQPTFPSGSIVDSGKGPSITPIPQGTTGPGDKGMYSRVGDVPPVNNIPTNVQMNNTEAPLRDAADKTRAAQEAVSNVNSIFDKKIQDFSSGSAESNLGRSRAITALLGVSGSSAATDLEGGAVKTNNKTTDALNAQRAQKIAAIYGDLNQATTADTEAYQKNTQADAKTIADEQSKRAGSVLTSLATELGNVSYGQFKAADPSTYQKILGLAGGDDAKLELLYNSSMSPTAKTKSTYHWENGQAFEIDGSGNAKRRSDLDTATPAAQTGSSKVVNIGGTLFNFPVDAKGNYQIDPDKSVSDYIFKGSKEGQFKTTTTPKPKAPPTPATPLTKPQYAKLESTGIDQGLADKLTAAILKGIPLDQIRDALRKDNTDPAILDHYDNVVGIDAMLKNAKPKATSTTSGGFGGGAQ